MKNRYIEKASKLYEKAKVVMLPTKHYQDEETFTSLYKHNDKLYYGVSGQVGINQKEYQSQHLYFLSDEEIKRGDWIIRENYPKPVIMGDDLICKGDKKIIASTDESLAIKSSDSKILLKKLPRPSNEFLQAYCKADGKIDEVLIEVEEEPIYGNNGSVYPISYQLKVAKDNTITIIPATSAPVQEMKATNTQAEFILFSPEKAPEYYVVMDVKDRELIYLGKDKQKANKIFKSLNMHDELINGIIESKRILGELSGKDCEAIGFSQEFLYGSYQKFKSLLEQAEQK